MTTFNAQSTKPLSFKAKFSKINSGIVFASIVLVSLLSSTILFAQQNKPSAKPNSVGRLPDHAPANVIAAATLSLKETDFQTALANADSLTAQNILVANGMPSKTQVVIHALGGSSTDPNDNINGPCYRWGWIYSSTPTGGTVIMWGCVSYIGSLYYDNGGIWYWQ